VSSFEKGSCERNHELVRYIHYKGWSFDETTQDDLNLLFSNINSYPRKSLNQKTPYQCVLEDTRLGKEFLDLINISKIESDDVILNPSLLKKIKK
jgi:IS30 family transposase